MTWQFFPANSADGHEPDTEGEEEGEPDYAVSQGGNGGVEPFADVRNDGGNEEEGYNPVFPECE